MCGKCIYNRSTYTVKSSGYFISSSAEFTSGMKNGMNNFHRRNSHLRMFINRHTSSVVFHHNGIITLNGNMNRLAVTCKSFIYTIINDFIYEMMKSLWACTSYIHAGSFSYCFKTLKNLYLGGIILPICFLF